MLYEKNAPPSAHRCSPAFPEPARHCLRRSRWRAGPWCLAPYHRSRYRRAQDIQRQCRSEADGFNIDQVAQRVAAILGVKCEHVWEKGKHPQTVKARSLLCYWAVGELGISATELARRIGITQPAISQSVKRGEAIAKINGFERMDS